ncbi:hypothetical protein BJ508DRAFT_49126 [Ascobolus immersus RN42]|uniref:Uncharacterized protein n=1 Tax=Ascobolus immersus RN42 TaxID=1160509 RepID=A0A3N4HHN4_ASCIM|nr:hypothetical protein BJ508DRAFT_49126 [Ascobolus immersus RN42]
MFFPPIQPPTFKTRRALIIIDLQTTYLPPGEEAPTLPGPLPVTNPDFIPNTLSLLTEFRREGGLVIFTLTDHTHAQPLDTVRVFLDPSDPLSPPPPSSPPRLLPPPSSPPRLLPPAKPTTTTPPMPSSPSPPLVGGPPGPNPPPSFSPP